MPGAPLPGPGQGSVDRQRHARARTPTGDASTMPTGSPRSPTPGRSRSPARRRRSRFTKSPDVAGDTSGTIAAGSPGVFTIMITNTGGSPANNVTLDDMLPNDGGLTWTLTSATRHTPAAERATLCDALVGGNTLNCNFGHLAAGARITSSLTSGNTPGAPLPGPELQDLLARQRHARARAPTGDAWRVPTGSRGHRLRARSRSPARRPRSPSTSPGRSRRTPAAPSGRGPCRHLPNLITSTGNATANPSRPARTPGDGGLGRELTPLPGPTPAPTNVSLLRAGSSRQQRSTCEQRASQRGATLTIVVINDIRVPAPGAPLTGDGPGYLARRRHPGAGSTGDPQPGAGRDHPGTAWGWITVTCPPRR